MAKPSQVPNWWRYWARDLHHIRRICALRQKRSAFPVPKEKGKEIQTLEGNMPESGRPSLFPGKKVEARSISLPAEYWRKMKEPYSIAIAAAVFNTYFIKKK